MGGARSISQCVVLWSDGVLQRIAGWLRIPDESTVGRLFKEVSERHIGELKTLVHEVRKRVWARALRAGRSRIAIQCQQWVDADSSVKTVYGKQQGTAKGYNPHKRGAPSYHPLLAFCTDTKEILQAWLRTGSAYTSNGIVEFMKQLLAQLPDYHHIVFRADSGFFVGALMDLLDAVRSVPGRPTTPTASGPPPRPGSKRPRVRWGWRTSRPTTSWPTPRGFNVPYWPTTHTESRSERRPGA